MLEGLNLFCKEKVDKYKLAKVLKEKEDNILMIDTFSKFTERKDQEIVVLDIGISDEEDEYPEYYIYDISLFRDDLKQKFKDLEDENIVVYMD